MLVRLKKQSKLKGGLSERILMKRSPFNVSLTADSEVDQSCSDR